jgi:hypothetical protein
MVVIVSMGGYLAANMALDVELRGRGDFVVGCLDWRRGTAPPPVMQVAAPNIL